MFSFLDKQCTNAEIVICCYINTYLTLGGNLFAVKLKFSWCLEHMTSPHCEIQLGFRPYSHSQLLFAGGVFPCSDFVFSTVNANLLLTDWQRTFEALETLNTSLFLCLQKCIYGHFQWMLCLIKTNWVTLFNCWSSGTVCVTV